MFRHLQISVVKAMAANFDMDITDDLALGLSFLFMDDAPEDFPEGGVEALATGTATEDMGGASSAWGHWMDDAAVVEEALLAIQNAQSK